MESPKFPLHAEEQCRLNPDAASTESILSDAAVFDLPPLKVTVCSIPLKVDEKRNRNR